MKADILLQMVEGQTSGPKHQAGSSPLVQVPLWVRAASCVAARRENYTCSMASSPRRTETREYSGAGPEGLARRRSAGSGFRGLAGADCWRVKIIAQRIENRRMVAGDCKHCIAGTDSPGYLTLRELRACRRKAGECSCFLCRKWREASLSAHWKKRGCRMWCGRTTCTTFWKKWRSLVEVNAIAAPLRQVDTSLAGCEEEAGSQPDHPDVCFAGFVFVFGRRDCRVREARGSDFTEQAGKLRTSLGDPNR